MTMDAIFEAAPWLTPARDLVELGGPVLIGIGVLTFAMWLLICERALFLLTTHRRNVRTICAAWADRPERRSWHAHQIRERWISLTMQALERHVTLIRTCVALCPLFGLLGTVTGMVQVFEVMAVAGSGNPRSMANGVAHATVPTMAGMVAALSGLAASAYLSTRVRRERLRLEDRLIPA